MAPNPLEYNLREKPNTPLWDRVDDGHWIAFNRWADTNEISEEFTDWIEWWNCFAYGIARGITYADEQLTKVAGK